MKVRPLLDPISRGRPNQGISFVGTFKLLLEHFQSGWGKFLPTWKRYLEKPASPCILPWQAGSQRSQFSQSSPGCWPLVQIPSCIGCLVCFGFVFNFHFCFGFVFT